MACTYTGTAWIVIALSLLALAAVPVQSDQCTTDIGAFFSSNYTLELLQFEQANARSRDDIGNYISCTGVTGAHFCEIYSVGKDGRASTTGVCGPKSCNEQALMGPDGQLVLKLVAGYTPASITGVRCLSNKTPPVEGSGAVGSVVVFSALAVVIVACTGLHWWQTRARAPNKRERRPSNHLQDESAEPAAEAIVDKKQLSLVSLFVRELSLITSFKKLTQPAKLPMSLRMLDGMRALSMVWVITGHSYQVGLTNMDNAIYAARNIVSRFSFQMVMNGALAVDTFFFLSGFLGAYVLHSKLRKRFATVETVAAEGTPLLDLDVIKAQRRNQTLGIGSGLVTFMTMITHRYLRLTPLMGLLLLFYVHTMPLMGKGPFWWTLMTDQDPFGRQCGKYWWTNLLYINNLYPDQFEAHGDASLGCMSWTWYLANDMQLFCLIPIIMMVHLKCRKAGYALLTSLFVTSMACIIGMSVHYGFYFCPLPSDAGSDPANQTKLSYNKPWTRALPYLLGTALALYIRDYKPKIRRPSFLGLVLWYTLAGFLCATPIFITFDARYSEGHQAGTCRWSHSAQIAWNCTYRLSWSIGLIMLALPGFFDWPNPITPILGSRIWTVPARLTFAAYLVHPIIMVVVTTGNNGRADFSDFAYIINAGGYIFWSYIVAAFLYCFVESPFTLIDTLLFERVLSRKSDKPHSSRGGR